MLLDERGFVDHKSIITFYLNQGSESARADKEIACHGLISTTLRGIYMFPKFVLEDHSEHSTVEP